MRTAKERCEDILRTALSIGTTSSTELPAMIFFKPKDNFKDWAKRIEAQVVDCGAGMGHLEGLFPEIIMIDIFGREGSNSNVRPMDAQHFPFFEGQAALVARPNAGHWIHNTFDQALENGARVFYVGLQKNYERDLEGYDCKLIMSDVGEAGEELWEILRRSA